MDHEKWLLCVISRAKMFLRQSHMEKGKKRYVSRKVEKCMTKVNCIGFPRANVMDLIHPRNGDKFTETFKYSGRGQKESRKSTKMSLFI